MGIIIGILLFKRMKDIVTKNTLYIEDENMRNAIIEETKKNDNLKLLEDEMEWNTVVIEYGAD